MAKKGREQNSSNCKCHVFITVYIFSKHFLVESSDLVLPRSWGTGMWVEEGGAYASLIGRVLMGDNILVTFFQAVHFVQVFQDPHL